MSPRTAPVRAAGGWLTAAPRPGARLRLFCFHHAGGGASAYSGWQRALPHDVNVLPVQLPGREQRAQEPRITDADELARQLDTHLGPHLDDTPHVLYGHSMGAVTAYHLARLRSEQGKRPPEALFVGGYGPPQRPAALTGSRSLPDEAFARRLVAIGGMSETLLAYPDWMRAATRLVRDDLSICAPHGRDAHAPLPCAVHAFVGDRDPLVSRDDAAGWEPHAGAGFHLHVRPGGHFFHREHEADFLRALRPLLDHYAAPRVAN